jgi:thiamine biosynthesis protein ThiS
MITVNNQKIEFHNGMTAADALKAAGEVIDASVLVMADGKILPHNELDIELVAENTQIKLLPVITGG